MAITSRRFVVFILAAAVFIIMAAYHLGSGRNCQVDEFCQMSIKWAMAEGIKAHPEWYPGLTESSLPEDFHTFLHERGAVGARGRRQCPHPVCPKGNEPMTTGILQRFYGTSPSSNADDSERSSWTGRATTTYEPEVPQPPAHWPNGGASSNVTALVASPKLVPPSWTPRLHSQARSQKIWPRRSGLARMAVAFLVPGGPHKVGLNVAVRSACLTASNPKDLSLYVMAREEDTETLMELNDTWHSSRMLCPLTVFTFFDSARFDWGAQLHKVHTPRFANVFNFIQHVNLPAEVGRRGVDVALLADTDVLFQGDDPAKRALKECVALLTKSPDHIGCAKQTRSGYGVGIWLVNTARWAAHAWDKQLWAFMLAQDKVEGTGGTKPLLNSFIEEQNIGVSLLFDGRTFINSLPEKTPCRSRLTHFAGENEKPWQPQFAWDTLNCTDEMMRPSYEDPEFDTDSDAQCKMWAYCQWHMHHHEITSGVWLGASKVGTRRRPRRKANDTF